MLSGHKLPLVALKPDAENINGVFVKLRLFMVTEADLLSLGKLSVSIAMTPLVIFTTFSRFVTPLKFNVLFPKSTLPNVEWFIVAYVHAGAACPKSSILEPIDC